MIRRRLRSKFLGITDNLIAAFKRGQTARELGEPVTACHENPMSDAMQRSWKRGWRAKDKELRDAGRA